MIRYDRETLWGRVETHTDRREREMLKEYGTKGLGHMVRGMLG
jgi:hypothetical protein